MIEALICTKNWLSASPQLVVLRECMDKMEVKDSLEVVLDNIF